MTQLGYFTLETIDIGRAKPFCGILFGWTIDAEASKSTQAHVAGSTPAFGFTKVERTGGRSAMPSDSPSGRSATVHDDQRVAFSLWQPAPGYV